MSDADLNYLDESMSFDELNEIRIAKELVEKAAALEARRDLERLRQEIRTATINQVWIENYGEHFSVTIEGVLVDSLTKDPLASFRCHGCGERLPSRMEELLRESVEVFLNKDYVRSFSLESVSCSDCGEPNEVVIQMIA